MKIAGKLCELGARALLLAFLLVLADLLVVIVEVASNLLVFRLHVLKILLASVEIVFPTTHVVSTVAIQDRVSNRLFFFPNKCLFVGLRTVGWIGILTIFKRWWPSVRSRTSVESSCDPVSFCLRRGVQCDHGRLVK